MGFFPSRNGILPTSLYRDEAWDYSQMEKTRLAREVERRMEALLLNPKSLSKKAKLNETWVRDLLEGRTLSPRHVSLQKLATALGCGIGDLTGDAPAIAHRDPAPENVAAVDELDVRAAAGPGQLVDETAKVISEWRMPRDLLRAATQSPTERIKILTIVGDSMMPTFHPTEKVMVDTADTTPSPPGVFVIWDGLGVVAKRIEHIPDSDPPRVRIMSDNPRYQPYERTLDEAYVQARIIGKWLWT
jgi:phage repressor protein C with HTH and peptisase S24 domain